MIVFCLSYFKNNALAIATQCVSASTSVGIKNQSIRVTSSSARLARNLNVVADRRYIHRYWSQIRYQHPFLAQSVNPYGRTHMLQGILTWLIPSVRWAGSCRAGYKTEATLPMVLLFSSKRARSRFSRVSSVWSPWSVFAYINCERINSVCECFWSNRR